MYISHLDLMRLFQRAFKRAGLDLTHTQGYNPRPSVSIALPLSVGVESHCELLDFDLDGEQIPCEEIMARLNRVLVDGVRVLSVYNDGSKLKNLALLDCSVYLTYDGGVAPNVAEDLDRLFAQPLLMVEKKGKNGTIQQDIIPMIRQMRIVQEGDSLLRLDARICCQNPTLNPAQITAAIARYLPEQTPDFARYCRMEIYDQNEEIFR